MNTLRTYSVLLLISFLFASCLKEDTPIYPTAKETVQIPMGTSYADQFYYDLASNTIITNHPRGNWDLAFESTTDGYRVFLNDAKFMFLNKTGSTNFDDTFTYNAEIAITDEADGNPEKTAIGDWGTWNGDDQYIGNGEVYLIDRGVTSSGASLGYKKLVLNSLIDNTYSITFSNLDGTEVSSVELNKNADYNLVYVSFDNGGEQVYAAPEKDTWDLRFSMYTKVFTTNPGDDIPFEDGDTIPYLVNGVLINPYNVAATEMTTTSFDSLELSQVVSSTLSNEEDVIGYDWKFFSLQANGYTVDTTKVYIIKDRQGDYFKLRFIDFYSQTGEKGYPTFEVKPMQ